MKKRILWSAFAMTALLVLGFFAPDIFWSINGLIRGEAFYDGKPTSWWRGMAQREFRRRENPAMWRPAPFPGQSWHDDLEEWKRDWNEKRSAAELDRWNAFMRDPEGTQVARQLFHDHDLHVRAMGAVALCGHGKAVEHDLADLIAYIRNGSESNAKSIIAGAMHEIGGPDLLPMLVDWHVEDEALAWYAYVAIKEFGPEREQIIPRLAKHLGTEAGERSARTLALIGVKALPALEPFLKHQNVIVRRHATMAVADMDDANEKCTVQLKRQLSDPDPRVRCIAVRPLAKVFGGRIENICTVLKVYNDDPDPSVQEAALTSLVLYFYINEKPWEHDEHSKEVLTGLLQLAQENQLTEILEEAERALDQFMQRTRRK
jgi:HEAT repeat protein